MYSLYFQRQKAHRLLASYGETYTFYGYTLNEFGEQTSEEVVVSITGVYHEAQGYVTTTGQEGANIKTKPSSLIFCMLSEVSEIREGMTTYIQGKKYRVTDLRDINNWNIVCDISLELVLNNA